VNEPGHFAPPELSTLWGRSGFYKHFVPPGRRKIYANLTKLLGSDKWQGW